MENLDLPQVLPAQYEPTDEDVKSIQAAGLRLVAKPDVKIKPCNCGALGNSHD